MLSLTKMPLALSLELSWWSTSRCIYSRHSIGLYKQHHVFKMLLKYCIPLQAEVLSMHCWIWCLWKGYIPAYYLVSASPSSGE